MKRSPLDFGSIYVGEQLTYPRWLEREQRRARWLRWAKTLGVVVAYLLFFAAAGLVIGGLATGYGL